MSEAKFSPLLSLARHAQRRRMEMQCDPQWVLDVFAERDALRAEVERLRKDTKQSDTVAVPRELYTCIGKGGKYELVGKSQGAGELKHQQLLVYRSTDTGLLYHRTPDDFHARMALLAGGEA